MEILLFAAALFVCLFVVLPFWIVTKLRRVSALEVDMNAAEGRIEQLSQTVARLRGDLDAVRARLDEPMVSAGSVLAPTPATAPVSMPVPVVAPPPRPAPVKAAQPEPRTHEAEPTARASAPEPVHPWTRPAAPVHVVRPADLPTTAPAPMSTSTARPLSPSPAPAVKDASAQGAERAELEETLGANWLNKLGAALLVLGVVFFLSYQLRTLGPLGKDLVGLAIGGTLLVGGVVAEKRSQYQMFSRGVMAAGWGVLFFTGFAMHYLAAARVIDSELGGLLLMLTVAGGMVGHALRYRSQVVTGLALLFAFGTVTISHDAAFTLTACAVLALTSAVISLRMKWIPLEIGAIAATYVNHFVWLPQLASDHTGNAAALFTTSLVLLAAYWVIYRVSFVLRGTLSADEEGWATLGAALNTCGVIAVASRYPLGATVVSGALLAFGVADAAVARLVRSRRTAYSALVVMSAALVAAAVPVRFGVRIVAVAWFIEAEALVWLGIRTRDRLFLRVGLAGLAMAALHLFAFNVLPLVQPGRWQGPLSTPSVSVLLALAASLFYGNSLVLRRRHPDVFAGNEGWVTDQLSFVGAAALLALAWTMAPTVWLAPTWSVLGLLLVAMSQRLRSDDIYLQGHVVAGAGAARVLAVNVLLIERSHLSIVGALPVLLVAAVHHALALRHTRPSGQAEAETAVAHSWTGTALVGVVSWYLFAPLSLALVWTLGAALLLEGGIRRARRDLRLQAMVATAAGFTRVLLVNLNGTSGLTGTAVVSTLPVVALFYYLYDRLEAHTDARSTRWVPAAVAAAGTVAMAAVLRVAVVPAVVAPTWAALALLLTLVTTLTRRPLFVRHAALVALAVGAQAVAVNLYGASYFESTWTGPLTTVGASAVALMALLPFARRHRTATSSLFDLWNRPDRAFFFVPLISVAWMLAMTLQASLVTLAWGAEAVAAFLTALWLRERSFRFSALGLLLAAVGRIVLVDVWRLQQQGRYLAFIGLGLALLLVSYLYSRYRARLKEFL